VHTISRKERIQALVFLVVGVLVIALVCGVLIGVPLLKDTRQYFVRFHESIPFDEGTDVKYRGVKKGRVRTISIDYDEIQVELELDPNLRVTETTLARISAAGLLGPYFVELYGTMKDSAELPEGALIKTDPSTMKTFVDKGTLAAERIEVVLKNLERWTGTENEQRFAKILDEATAAITTANQTMTTIKPEAERFVTAYADAAEELKKAIAENRGVLNDLLDESRKAASEINRFLASGRLDQVANEASRSLESVRADFARASGSFTKFLEDAKIDERLGKVVASLERTEQNLAKLTGSVESEVLGVTRGELLPALNGFREAMSTLNELTRVLRDDPSLLLFSRPREEIRIPRPGDR
jgi:ABC-type transporter Mla subunit MlaD